MDAGLWVTLIIGIATPVLTLVGVIITNNKSTQKQSNKIDDYQKLTVYRIEQLEKKQDIHNGVIERVYTGEGSILELQHEVRDLKNELKDIRNRMDELHTV